MLECVVNLSEGRDPLVLERLAAVVGDDLLDLHRDPHHHRSVFTLLGEEAPRALARAAVAALDLRGHDGVHPRIGVVDVVPFVPLSGTDLTPALEARDRFADWMADELGVPCFRYGPQRTLPAVRRSAWRDLPPDTGGPEPHPTAGGCAVGARPVLIAYNLWLATPDLAAARRVAARLRQPGVRTLGLAVGTRVQLSMNLVDPSTMGPLVVERAARALLREEGNDVAGAELVGLLPESVLAAIPRADWERLDLSDDRTIEYRVARALRQ